MTEQSNAELAHDIGMDAIDWDMVRDGVGDPEEAASIAVRAALEAAEQRAELAEANLSVEENKNAGYRAKNNQLAAVVEKVRSVIESESGWFRYRAERVSDILATAPAVALREVKAEAIREYVTAARENPHTYYWPPSGVLDDAEQWADEIEKGTI